MKQIMEIASSMGLGPDSETEPSRTADMENAARQVSQLIARSEKQEHRQQTLVRALLPYLNPRRQARLERALQLSNLSRLAGSALQSGLLTATPEGGDSSV